MARDAVALGPGHRNRGEVVVARLPDRNKLALPTILPMSVQLILHITGL